MMRFFVALCLIFASSTWPVSAAIVVDFDSLPVGPGGYYAGDPSADSPYRDHYEIVDVGEQYGAQQFDQRWSSGGVSFNNRYNPTYSIWSGWSWSNMQDSTTSTFDSQYAAFPGGGADGLGGVTAGGQYAVAYGSGAFFNLPEAARLQSLELSNVTYAALSMRDGDGFAKQFGGASGNDPDFLEVTFTGYSSWDAMGDVTGEAIVRLADFTFADSSLDYILDHWLQLDLTPLGGARSVGIAFESTDVGEFGINTPTYLAIDNLTLTAVPEPATLSTLGLMIAGVWGVRQRRRLRIEP